MIRPAAPDEATVIAAIVAAAYAHYIPRMGGQTPGPMLDDYATRIAAGEAWVLDDGGIVGVLVLSENPDGFLLDNVALLPAAQGRGLGAQMMAFAEAEAMRLGFDEIKLYTHVTMTENIARYTRLGYVETGRRTEDGLARVFMSKVLRKGAVLF